MSETEQDSVSERELAEYFQENVFSPGPKSVGEALETSTAVDVESAESPAEDGEVTVVDAPVQPEVDTPPGQEPAPVAAEPGAEPESEDAEEDIAADDLVVRAEKRFGEDRDTWAKVLLDQDQMISRQGNTNKELEEWGQGWLEYAQALEAQTQQAQAQMPRSAAEEEWIEASVSDPLGYARAAAFNGNIGLFQDVLRHTAENVDPLVASQIGSRVQIEMAQYVQEGEQAAQPPPLDQELYQSFSRLQLDPEQAIAAITPQIANMNQYHPYRIAILAGDEQQRDLAVQALWDLAGAGGHVTTRRDDARSARIKREGELRRETAGVVTGSPHTPPPTQSPFMDAMEAEWKQRGQWSDE
jgi:hypothetical protein